MLTFPATVTLANQLGCSIQPLSSVTMQSAAYCLIETTQVQVLQPFYSQGYASALDGAMVFTLKDIVINNESNSPYGTFKIDIFD
jgi:hypothetical protein